MSIHDSIERKLNEALAPTQLEVINESARHKGHPGAGHGRETHFRVTVTSDLFTGKSLVARQRMVYALLTDEMNAGLHALSLITRAPGEAV